MKMKEIILTIGVSASGKSTWAEKYCDDFAYVNINRDDIRFSLFTNNVRDWTKYKFSNKNERRVTDVQEQLALEAASSGKSICISDTNINPKIRKKWEGWAKDYGYQYSEIIFPCNWQTLVKRNAQRDGGLSEALLWGQYQRYMQQFGTLGEEEVNIEIYEDSPSLDHTIICDLDGTIADMKGIRKPFEWSEVGQDKPRSAIIDMLVGRAMRVGHITFMSGRDGCCYEETKAWIEQHVDLPDHVGWQLIMRKPDDWRKDDVVKYELFDTFVRGKYNVDCVFDDRYSIIRLWSILGLPNIVQVGAYNNEF